MKDLIYYRIFALFAITFILFMVKNNQVIAQPYEIKGLMQSEAYTDVSGPIAGCTDMNICVKVLNMTDPAQTLDNVKIQILIDGSFYQILDPGVFVNTGLVDPIYGYTIYETTQDGLMSDFDPNYSGPEDGYYRYCMKVRIILTAPAVTNFMVNIIIGQESVSYFSNFDINKLIEQIGVDNNSITYLSQIAVATNTLDFDGYLLKPELACAIDNGLNLPQTFVLHGKLIVNITYCFMEIFTWMTGQL